MNYDEKLLYKEFLKIKKRGWIKTMKKGYGGVGYTFERLLGKEVDSFRIPDFHGIEIKTMRYFSRHKITMFSASPDGDTLFAIPRILSQLGYPDKLMPNCKVLSVSVNAKDYVSVGYKRIKAEIDWEKEKINLVANNVYGKTYNLETSWSFQLLKDAFYTKLSNLAVIKACYKSIDNEDYYYYTNIYFYKRKDFNDFLKLIENGVIEINIHIGVWREGNKVGKIHDRGTSFSIHEEDLEKLFNKVQN